MPVERPLRVLHVIDSLGAGGAEQNLVTLLRHLPQSDYEHHAAWLYPDEPLLPDLAPHLASMLRLEAGRGVNLVGAAVKLARYMNRIRPDVVSAKLVRAQLVARFATFLSGRIPTVSTWECLTYRDDMYESLGRRGPWLRRLTWLLDAGSGLGDAHIIAVSREIAEHNARKLRVDPRRVSVIYNAYEPKRITGIDESSRQRLRRELGVADHGHLLLSVGRLIEQKDHPTSINAMSEVARRLPHALLVIAGTGDLQMELQAQIDALRLRQNVRLLGRRGDVPALLATADLFVFPSLYEGNSIALMEALAAGLPAVLSRITSSLEVVESSPSVRYFTPGDSAGLASAIIESLANLPVLKAAAELEARRTSERFAPGVMARGYDEVYRRAARLI
jgi:glycosyltransferase involved in cell wall biosynthesis